MARYDAARGYLEQAQSPLLPTLAIGGHADADKQSANRPLRSANQPTYYGDNMAAAGCPGISICGARSATKSRRARRKRKPVSPILQAVRLSLQAQLADDYLQLRGLDDEARLLSDAIAIYGKALALTNERHDKGIASGLDVGRAQAQFSDAQAQLSDVLARRALLEHAIASLVGEPASSFPLPPQVADVKIAQCSGRRSFDAVAAPPRHRRRPNAWSPPPMPTSAWRGPPSIRIFRSSALAGFQNTGNDALFTAPNAFWALGPTVAMTLFDNGLHEGELAVAKAANASAAAAYRGTVLKAFQEVEDNLALLNRLAEAADAARDTSVKAATHTQDLALALYRNGALGFWTWWWPRPRRLQAQQQALQIQTRRLAGQLSP